MGLTNLRFSVGEPLYCPNGGIVKQLLSDSYEDYFVEGTFDKFLGHQSFEDYPIDISRACDLEAIILTLILCSMTDTVNAELEIPRKDFDLTGATLKSFLLKFNVRYRKLSKFFNNELPNMSALTILSSESTLVSVSDWLESSKIEQTDFSIILLKKENDGYNRSNMVRAYCHDKNLSHVIIQEV